MPGKNFRRLNELSCLDCSKNHRDRNISLCAIDNGPITDNRTDCPSMPMCFICDDFEQKEWSK